MVEINKKEKFNNKTHDNNCVIRYAWGNEELRTWFITKTPDGFLPKGSRLLFRLGCEKVNGYVSISDSYPKIGDIINDVDNNKLKIKNIEWI